MTTAPQQSHEESRPFGREETIAAAIRVAADRLVSIGPSRMTVRSVADEAGVNHALVHRHLGTKEQLVSLALESLAKECDVAIRRSLARGSSPMQLAALPAVRRYVRALASTLTHAPGLARQSDHPVLHNLSAQGTAGGLDSDAAHARAIAQLSTAFGFALFAPFLADAAGLPEARRGLIADNLDRALGALDDELGLS